VSNYCAQYVCALLFFNRSLFLIEDCLLEALARIHTILLLVGYVSTMGTNITENNRVRYSCCGNVRDIE
jgi:hypothetical protein